MLEAMLKAILTTAMLTNANKATLKAMLTQNANNRLARARTGWHLVHHQHYPDTGDFIQF